MCVRWTIVSHSLEYDDNPALLRAHSVVGPNKVRGKGRALSEEAASLDSDQRPPMGRKPSEWSI